MLLLKIKCHLDLPLLSKKVTAKEGEPGKRGKQNGWTERENEHDERAKLNTESERERGIERDREEESRG